MLTKNMEFQLLKSLVNVKSVYPEENQLSMFINSWVKRNVNCRSEAIPLNKNRVNRVYVKGTGKYTVALAGHMDTIPIVNGWQTDPFETVIKKNRLFGLGAWDMKAGLFVMLNCLKNFIPKNITLMVIFTVDEENYSQGIHKVIDSGICNDINFVLVPEPNIFHGDKSITLGRTGRAVFTIDIYGKSAHGGSIEKGINAIDQANLLINELEKITRLFPRAIDSLAKGVSVPDLCRIEMDCKLVSPERPETIMKKIYSVVKKLLAKKILYRQPKIAFVERPTPFCIPYRLDKNIPEIKLCRSVMKKITGQSIPVYNDLIADECIFVERLKVPAVCIGPSGNNVHQANESVDLESVEKVQKIYLKILQELDNKFKN